MTTLVDIDCSRYDCTKVAELAMSKEGLDDYMSQRGIEPGTERAKSFSNDLFRIYAKCCLFGGTNPQPPAEDSAPLRPEEISLIHIAMTAGFAIPIGLPGPQDPPLTPAQIQAIREWLRAIGRRLLAYLVRIPAWGWAIAYVLAMLFMNRKTCSDLLVNCLLDDFQPPWNQDDFGVKKDCGACFRECVQTGVWPFYRCPG